MSETNVKFAVANLIERKNRTGMVFGDGLLTAIVQLSEYTKALEQRIAALEKNQAAVTCGETAKRVFTDLYSDSDADTDKAPVDHPEGA